MNINVYFCFTDPSSRKSALGEQDVLCTFRAEFGWDQIVYGTAGGLVLYVRAADPAPAPASHPRLLSAGAQVRARAFDMPHVPNAAAAADPRTKLGRRLARALLISASEHPYQCILLLRRSDAVRG